MAKSMSSLTDEQMAERAFNAVKKMYPVAGNAEYRYIDFARSNWAKYENIEMAYSFIAAGGSVEDCYAF